MVETDTPPRTISMFSDAEEHQLSGSEKSVTRNGRLTIPLPDAFIEYLADIAPHHTELRWQYNTDPLLIALTIGDAELPGYEQLGTESLIRYSMQRSTWSSQTEYGAGVAAKAPDDLPFVIHAGISNNETVYIAARPDHSSENAPVILVIPESEFGSAIHTTLASSQDEHVPNHEDPSTQDEYNQRTRTPPFHPPEVIHEDSIENQPIGLEASGDGDEGDKWDEEDESNSERGLE